MKKDLMKHGECVLHKVFISYLVLGFLRISFIALFRGLEDAEISQKQEILLFTWKWGRF